MPLPYPRSVEWDHLFDDLEGQLASEWEAERAALDAESERLRISKLTLRERLRALCAQQSTVTLELGDGLRMRARLRALGADWIAVAAFDDPRLLVIPIGVMTTIDADHGSVLGSLDGAGPTDALRERMTLGFLLRDLARRRIPISVLLTDGAARHGTVDRAAADHLDLALHGAGEPRTTATVSGFRLVPFSALRWLRIEPVDTALP